MYTYIYIHTCTFLYRYLGLIRTIDFLFIPSGSYPTPFLGRLLLKITGPNHKTRYPKRGVGYEPLGISYIYICMYI